VSAWSDPATPTEPGAPYAGPPATDPPPAPGYGFPGYGPPGYGPPGYGPPGYGPYGGYPAAWPAPPGGPRRPGQVIAAAVLTFVQAGLVLLASFYVGILGAVASSIAEEDPTLSRTQSHALGTEAVVLAIVQGVSALVLVVGGVLALNSRRRPALVLLLAALGVQVALSIYWAVRIATVLDDAPGNPTGPFLGFAALFAAGPLVCLGLLVIGPGRAWFSERGARTARADR
jgi:hypothetical protein